MTINNLGPNFSYGFNQTPKNKKEQAVGRMVDPENLDNKIELPEMKTAELDDWFKLRFNIPLS